MCFSAQAGFLAGVSLSVAGVATLTAARKRAEVPFALIPLLFGIQQITEGVIWLTFASASAQVPPGLTTRKPHEVVEVILNARVELP